MMPQKKGQRERKSMPAHNLTKEQKAEVKEAFDLFDVDGGGE